MSHFSCYNWNKGLNNSFIDNYSKDYPCIINIPLPNSCYYSAIGPYFDFTKKYRPTCLDSNLTYEKKIFLKDMKNLKYYKISKKNHFGYPLTNNNEFEPNIYGTIVFPGNKSFEKDINEKVILMDLYNKNKEKYYPNISKPEIEIILSKNGGKIEYNVKKNETLIKEREEIIAKNKNNLMYRNILILFIDTLSRAHFFRKFNKTINFLEQFSNYELNHLNKNMTSFQFFKYNSVGFSTDPNLKAAYYGAQKKGKGIHFANFFKNNGYIIGRINAYCEKETVFSINKPNLYKQVLWDHEGASLGCIKSFYKRFLISRLTSLIPKCLFGKDLNQHSLEYLESFWTAYIDQYKLFLFQTLEGHEPTGELIGYFDKTLYNFLDKFNKKGYFEDTIVFIFSDHGQHLTGPLYLFNSQDFFIERTLPVLFLLIPNDEKLYRDNLYEKIKKNSQIFITAYDIYNTFIQLSFGDNKEEYKKNSISLGGSLLSELNYKKRFCESPIYNHLEISKNICNCKIRLNF